MTDPIDASKTPLARSTERSPWRCFLWRVAQSTRHEGAPAQELADQLATPRLALWQRRDRQRPLTPLVSRDARDPLVLRPASKERS